jgi:uncharacterized repeat protein (TIGR04042 family)
MHFTVRWPDGQTMRCYSPSLVIEDHLCPGVPYPLDDFVMRSRTALRIASERVQARYGFPCGRALGQLAEIERRAAEFASNPAECVKVVSFDRAGSAP